MALEEERPEFGYFMGDSIYDIPEIKAPLIEGLLYEKDILSIDAPPKTGKSILLQQIMFSLTSGEPLFGILPVKKKCHVLFVQTEGDRCETVERITNMKKGLAIDDSMWVHCNLPGLALNKKECFDSFLSRLKELEFGFDVIMFDPLYTTIDGSMLEQEVAGEWIKNARVLRAEFGCAVVIANHPPKDMIIEGTAVERGGSPFGSQFWGAYFNTHMSLKKCAGHHLLQTRSQRSGKIVDRLELVLMEPTPLMYVLREENMDTSPTKVLMALAEFGQLTTRHIESKTQLSRATVYRALTVLIKQRKADKVCDGVYRAIPVEVEKK